jgi:phosphatidylglycerol---prolipoprotein diacylglyceryl transferase
VLFNWSYYSQNPHLILAFRQGGLAIHGAVLAGVLVLAVFCRVKKLNFWLMGDILAPSLILAQAIGRWGNYFNQEAYGVETDLPWAMFIDGAYRHPHLFL